MGGAVEKMSHIPLKHIAAEEPYEDNKTFCLETIEQYRIEGCEIKSCVPGAFNYRLDYEMQQNGMDKFEFMLAGMLFMIKYDCITPSIALAVWQDILDFEESDFSDVVNSKDMELIKQDIETIRRFFVLHPEFME